MKHGLSPAYLNTLLPPLQGYFSDRPIRYSDNFMAPKTKHQKYHKSFIPQTMRDWNDLEKKNNQTTTNSVKLQAHIKEKIISHKAAVLQQMQRT